MICCYGPLVTYSFIHHLCHKHLLQVYCTLGDLPWGIKKNRTLFQHVEALSGVGRGRYTNIFNYNMIWSSCDRDNRYTYGTAQYGKWRPIGQNQFTGFEMLLFGVCALQVAKDSTIPYSFKFSVFYSFMLPFCSLLSTWVWDPSIHGWIPWPILITNTFVLLWIYLFILVVPFFCSMYFLNILLGIYNLALYLSFLILILAFVLKSIMFDSNIES